MANKELRLLRKATDAADAKRADDLADLLGTSPIARAMACTHEYEGIDGTERIVCRKCGLETTVTALARIDIDCPAHRFYVSRTTFPGDYLSDLRADGRAGSR